MRRSIVSLGIVLLLTGCGKNVEETVVELPVEENRQVYSLITVEESENDSSVNNAEDISSDTETIMTDVETNPESYANRYKFSTTEYEINSVTYSGDILEDFVLSELTPVSKDTYTATYNDIEAIVYVLDDFAGYNETVEDIRSNPDDKFYMITDGEREAVFAQYDDGCLWMTEHDGMIVRIDYDGDKFDDEVFWKILDDITIDSEEVKIDADFDTIDIYGCDWLEVEDYTIWNTFESEIHISAIDTRTNSKVFIYIPYLNGTDAYDDFVDTYDNYEEGQMRGWTAEFSDDGRVTTATVVGPDLDHVEGKTYLCKSGDYTVDVQIFDSIDANTAWEIADSIHFENSESAVGTDSILSSGEPKNDYSVYTSGDIIIDATYSGNVLNNFTKTGGGDGVTEFMAKYNGETIFIDFDRDIARYTEEYDKATNSDFASNKVINSDDKTAIISSPFGEQGSYYYLDTNHFIRIYGNSLPTEVEFWDIIDDFDVELSNATISDKFDFINIYGCDWLNVIDSDISLSVKFSCLDERNGEDVIVTVLTGNNHMPDKWNYDEMLSGDWDEYFNGSVTSYDNTEYISVSKQLFDDIYDIFVFKVDDSTVTVSTISNTLSPQDAIDVFNSIHFVKKD